MKRMVCEMCGGSDLQKQDGIFACNSCGCKYSVEEARKLMIESSLDTSQDLRSITSHDIINSELSNENLTDSNNSDKVVTHIENNQITSSSIWIWVVCIIAVVLLSIYVINTGENNNYRDDIVACNTLGGKWSSIKARCVFD